VGVTAGKPEWYRHGGSRQQRAAARSPLGDGVSAAAESVCEAELERREGVSGLDEKASRV